MATYIAGWITYGQPGGEWPEENTFDTFDAAKRCIIDRLKSLESAATDSKAFSARNGEEVDYWETVAEEYCSAAEDVNLMSSPFRMAPGNCIIWIKGEE